MIPENMTNIRLTGLQTRALYRALQYTRRRSLGITDQHLIANLQEQLYQLVREPERRKVVTTTTTVTTEYV